MGNIRFRAYIHSDVTDAEKKKILAILNDHCEVTEIEEEASHIIHKEKPYSADAYARPVFKQGNYIMIHWCYLPESYHSWIPNTFNLPVSNHNQLLILNISYISASSQKFFVQSLTI